jgi:hypothetical protein
MTVMLTFGHYAGFEFLCGRPHGMWFRLCLGWVALTVLGYDVEETLARAATTLDSLEGICEARVTRYRAALGEFTQIAKSLEETIEGIWGAWGRAVDRQDLTVHDEHRDRLSTQVLGILETARAYRARMTTAEAPNVVAESDADAPVGS